MIWAALHGQLDTARLLLQRGADVTIRNNVSLIIVAILLLWMWLMCRIVAERQNGSRLLRDSGAQNGAASSCGERHHRCVCCCCCHSSSSFDRSHAALVCVHVDRTSTASCRSSCSCMPAASDTSHHRRRWQWQRQRGTLRAWSECCSTSMCAGRSCSSCSSAFHLSTASM